MDRKWWTLIAVSFGVFMLLLDITVVNVALPDIQRSLNSSFSDVQWVIDAYSLTLAAFLLTSGSLADLFGRRLIFATGLVIFTCSSALCGFSTTPGMLNLSRGVQGVGGAMMFSTSLARSPTHSTAATGAPPSGSSARSTERPWRSGRCWAGASPREWGGEWIFCQRPDRHRRGLLDAHQGGRVTRPECEGRRLGRAGHLLGRLFLLVTRWCRAM